MMKLPVQCGKLETLSEILKQAAYFYLNTAKY